MLTSHVPPSIVSKRFLTSYPWSGSSARSPNTPYLSDKFLLVHTEYACRVCIDSVVLSRPEFPRGSSVQIRRSSETAISHPATSGAETRVQTAVLKSCQ